MEKLIETSERYVGNLKALIAPTEFKTLLLCVSVWLANPTATAAVYI